MGTKARKAEAARTDEPAIDAAAVISIAEHYHKAKTKHPYFADALFFRGNNPKAAKLGLRIGRDILEMSGRDGTLLAESVLQCEIEEATLEVAKGDKAAAVDELYDAIAVLLRMIDVIEGRQELGQPGAAKAKAKGAKARKGA